MKISLRCPMTARAKTVSGRKVQAFGMDRIVFDIPEPTEAELPVAFVFRSGRKGDAKQTYRQSAEGGQMYRNLGNFLKIDEDGNLSTLFHDQGSPFCAFIIRDDATLDMMAKSGNPTVPETRNHSRRWSSIRQHGLARIDEKDIGDRIAEIAAVLDTYAIVGNSVWEPYRTPFFRVMKGQSAWTVYLDQGFMEGDWGAYYFAIDEFDQACAFMDVLDAEVDVRPHVTGEVELGADYVSDMDGCRYDILRLAKLVMRAVVDNSDNLADFDHQVILAYSRLKKFATDFNDRHSDADIDLAVAEIGRLVELEEEGTLVRLRPPLENGGGILLPHLDHIERHVRRWEERGIDLEITPSAPTPR